MSFRDPNRIIELEGVNYVRGVVQAHNSIYQEIARENDQGNDCYIEFVINNVSSNSGVFVQIKSGDSYRDQKGYRFQTNKEHIEYWSNGLYPMVGIVYDITLKKAFWVNISEYIKLYPEILTIQNPTVRVSPSKEFSVSTFPAFIENFKIFIENYKGFENYGRSLDWFSKVDESEICYEGLKSLYANHRDRKSMWYYLISNFGKIKSEHIQQNILGILSIYNSNSHYFWHNGNIRYFPPHEIIDHISKLISAYFGKKEFKMIFPYLR